MRDDRRSLRPASINLLPHVLPGAMFILPLAFTCQTIAAPPSGTKAPSKSHAAAPSPAAPSPSAPSPAAPSKIAAAPTAPIAPAASAPKSAPDPVPMPAPLSGLNASAKDSPDNAPPQVQVAGKEIFTVQFQETDIAQALQMLSIQGKKNIITGKNVTGTVTANLFDVTVTEALDVILKANDLRYEEVGNFIYVYTREEWEQMQQARRKRESRRFTLEYISAKDANEFIAPLLSDVGKVAMVGNVMKAGSGVGGSSSGSSSGSSTAGDLLHGEDSWAFQAMLVVNDYPENIEAISNVVAEVDTPPQQVSVESTIVSTRVNEDSAFGIDFSVIGNVDFSDFVNPLGPVSNLLTGNNTPDAKGTDKLGFQPADNRAFGLNTSVGRTGAPGGLKLGLISKNVSVFLRVLDEVTDTMILARPRVLALNRQSAHILVGEKIGYLSTTTTQTATQQTVQYLDTGIKLIFRPFISKDGSIRLELAPSVSEAVLRQVTSDDGGGVVIPDEKTNTVTTNVRVRDGQTLVIGGLFQEKTTITRRQVPGLGDIPVLGNAFRGQDDELVRNEIIFLITPTIMKDSLASLAGKEATEYAEAVRIGAREGLLFFSRERMSSNSNQDALDAMAKGDTELALYHTENSLRINHNQPEMIRLRHELDQKQPNRVFERDMMKRLMNKHALKSAAPDSASEVRVAAPAVDPLSQPSSVASAEASKAAAPDMPVETPRTTQPAAESPQTTSSPVSATDGATKAPVAPASEPPPSGYSSADDNECLHETGEALIDEILAAIPAPTTTSSIVLGAADDAPGSLLMKEGAVAPVDPAAMSVAPSNTYVDRDNVLRFLGSNPFLRWMRAFAWPSSAPAPAGAAGSEAESAVAGAEKPESDDPE